MKKLEETSASRAATAIAAISTSIKAVLQGDKSGWEVMNDDGSLDGLIAFLREHDDGDYIRTIAQTKSNVRVLEVGADSGEKTSKLIK